MQDPLERLMAKFDITGQEGPGSALPKPETALQSPADDFDVQATAAPPASTQVKRAQSLTRRPRPTHRQQLKHALTVNAAHVITHDYLTLSQPLSEGLLLMDRTERKLKLIHSLGELAPLHSYTTEYGNTLTRHKKHKALLAGSIELDVATDEADFDKQLERAALQDGATLQLAHRQATYRAFSAYSSDQSLYGDEASDSASAVCGGASSAPGRVESASTGERLKEANAVARLEKLTARLGEMEEWFASVKAEASSDRQMREQATARLSLLQERIDRLQEQLLYQTAENKQLRVRLAELQNAEPETLMGRAQPMPLRAHQG
uniref:Uncharacterized protein n=1 Tax=Calcidiscus leptoporus TaxID=127549 RepID=A0A7S0NU94_9EUKA|mmetsp:Transcript_26911/g.62843  ORF Transcript_26911/g.62843 Transcript_26911/m.62843 type:complete len:321 (+) Transcript_26911:18-980(+)|eukprot:CAMPEP_0119368572 /NCGR_PEP_ID=MMETSP1334-20130426/15207_1 /TAXON_ID=127549 /ORGANISM="Calcidiscus leptoporus, Strain RCC1130" /LENGTH=320 /DNA_ID=CAMNT_0007385239 /DNA_START=15 /DNA_END=977 /DNA_ORIENTATION=-